MLYDKMLALHQQYADTPHSVAFPRPSFKVGCLLCWGWVCCVAFLRLLWLCGLLFFFVWLTDWLAPACCPNKQTNEQTTTKNKQRSSSCTLMKRRQFDGSCSAQKWQIYTTGEFHFIQLLVLSVCMYVCFNKQHREALQTHFLSLSFSVKGTCVCLSSQHKHTNE